MRGGKRMRVGWRRGWRGFRSGRVFTSPLQRARRTCELARFGAAAQIDPDLMEWDYGELEGKFSDVIHRERPDWDLFRDGAPGGESPEDVAKCGGSVYRQGEGDRRGCGGVYQRAYRAGDRGEVDRAGSGGSGEAAVLDGGRGDSFL